MNFTGERYIPGEGGCQLAYEHRHRYFYALRWAGDKRVLDLACGNGYGAALLARRARNVCALDIDGETIRDAEKNWRGSKLTFLQGDAACLPFQSGSFDLVVAMEAIEHIEDQEKLLREIARVCSSNGVALISTPNKAEYTDAREYANPFHKQEFYLGEFRDLLEGYFACVEIAGQQIRAGSLISFHPSGAAPEVFEDAVWSRESKSTEPMYYVAVCSQARLQYHTPAHSAYLDSSDGLFLEGKQEIDRLNVEIRRLGAWATELNGVVGERDASIRDLQDKAAAEIASLDQLIRNLQRELQQRDLTIQSLQRELQLEINDRDRRIVDLQNLLHVEIKDRDGRIVDLLNLLHAKEKEFDDRGNWALALQAEVERLSVSRKAWLYRVLARMGLLPE